MRVFEIFLPLSFGDGQPVPAAVFELLKQELTEKFGGVTAFRRSPAEGLWRDSGGIEQDKIVVFEVMTDKLEKAWWGEFRDRLEALFRQTEVLIRTSHAGKI